MPQDKPASIDTTNTVVTIARDPWPIKVAKQLPKRVNKQVSLWLRWAVFVASVVALALALPHKPWEGLLAQVQLLQANWSVVVLVVLLCPVNWMLEALKWQVLSHNYSKLTYKQALVGVLTGLGIGALMPQWLGDFMGRTWHQQHETRRQQLSAVPALWLGNFAAFQVTHFFGLVGLAFLVWAWPGTELNLPISKLGTAPLFIWSTAALLTLTLAIYYRVAWFAQPLLRLRPLGKWRADLERSLHFADSIRTQALLLAVARYLVFFSQWWLLLRLAQPEQELALAAAIALIFSLKSSVPTLNLLGDLGVREYAAVVVLQWLGWQATQVIPLTLCVWVINLLFPTLLGLLFLWPGFRKYLVNKPETA